MDKISANKVLATLGAIPETLTKLAAERDQLELDKAELQKQLAQYQLNERVDKIASEIHEKGIEQGRTVDETREFLLQKAASGQLDVVAEAVGLTAANAPLGHIGDLPADGNNLEDFVLS